jgi:hypothetical protein
MTSGKAALVGNQVEEAGYGLYSYLLLGAPPRESNRDRYLQILSDLVTSLPDIQRLEDSGSDRRELNITYVLLREAPPRELLRQAGGMLFAEWALSHYDYVRAGSMLGRLPRGEGDGPYIVSSLRPLAAGQSERGGYLFQDLSSVEPRCIKYWLNAFLDRATQPAARDRTYAMDLARRLREVLALAVTDCPGGEEAAQRWVRWSSTS